MPPVPPTPSSLACLQPHDPFPCDKQAAPSPTLSPAHPVPHRLLTLGSGLLTAFSLSLSLSVSLSLAHTYTHTLPLQDEAGVPWPAKARREAAVAAHAHDPKVLDDDVAWPDNKPPPDPLAEVKWPRQAAEGQEDAAEGQEDAKQAGGLLGSFASQSHQAAGHPVSPLLSPPPPQRAERFTALTPTHLVYSSHPYTPCKLDLAAEGLPRAIK